MHSRDAIPQVLFITLDGLPAAFGASTLQVAGNKFCGAVRRNRGPMLSWMEMHRQKAEAEREGWVHSRAAHHITPHRRENLQAVALAPRWPHPTDPTNLVNFMEI